MPAQRYTMRQARRRQDGAAAVEFALVVIPLLVLLLGIIQVSLWMWAKQAGAAGAREGARALAVSPACTDYENFVKGRVGPAASDWAPDAAHPDRGVDRSIVPDPANTSGFTKVGDSVQVTLQFEPVGGQALLPLFPDIKETATSRIENIPSTAGAC